MGSNRSWHVSTIGNFFYISWVTFFTCRPHMRVPQQLIAPGPWQQQLQHHISALSSSWSIYQKIPMPALWVEDEKDLLQITVFFWCSRLLNNGWILYGMQMKVLREMKMKLPYWVNMGMVIRSWYVFSRLVTILSSITLCLKKKW